MDRSVIVIQRIYVFLTVMGIVGIGIILSGMLPIVSRTHSFEVVIPTVCNLAICIGLKEKKEWVVPLIFICAAFGLLQSIAHIVSPAESLHLLVQKGVSLLYILFYGYQLRLFTTPEAQLMFSFKGTVLL